MRTRLIGWRDGGWAVVVSAADRGGPEALRCRFVVGYRPKVRSTIHNTGHRTKALTSWRLHDSSHHRFTLQAPLRFGPEVGVAATSTTDAWGVGYT
jgi:hypothetical protein